MRSGVVLAKSPVLFIELKLHRFFSIVTRYVRSGDLFMPIFLWKGKNSYGDKRSGQYEANDVAAVHAYLKKLRITPTKVKEKPKDKCSSRS